MVELIVCVNTKLTTWSVFWLYWGRSQLVVSSRCPPYVFLNIDRMWSEECTASITGQPGFCVVDVLIVPGGVVC